MRGHRWLWAVLAAALVGCGSTVGDPCTTPSECGGQLCINKDYTPGGYCSRQCDLADAKSCPTGTVCVKDGAAKDLPGCFLLCRSDHDCRSGYVCRSPHDTGPTVCVGPQGL